MRLKKINLNSGFYLLIGRNAFEEVAKRFPERISQVYKTRNFKSEFLTSRFNIEIQEDDWIGYQAGTDSHQGILAVIKRPNLRGIKELYDKQGLLIALDGVLDPQNLGSIFRIAECFGAIGVMYSSNRSSGITPVVTKASVGASELVNIYEVSNLGQSLENLKEHNWWVASAICDATSQELSTFDPAPKTILVLGSEGDGISSRVANISDFKIHIPMSGQIDSLNVAQATAVFSYIIQNKIKSLK